MLKTQLVLVGEIEATFFKKKLSRMFENKLSHVIADVLMLLKHEIKYCQMLINFQGYFCSFLFFISWRC